MSSGYQRGWRRMLVDMEIPDWEDRFLAQFDPEAMADRYVRAGADSVMFACKALTGLCFWPTAVGEVHPAARGRDLVGETHEALRARSLAPCAYYSVIYDNWAYERHPEWRFEPAGGWRPQNDPDDRHGHCCPNNEGYRDYVRAQIADLYGRYEFDCAFCDMSFWPGVCVCDSCRRRHREESGEELPETVDWLDPAWCGFQAARERWIDEFQGLISGAMREARPGIAVYHNFAIGPVHWRRAVPFSVTEHSDFLGGDMYGDEVEQLLVMKLMNGLSRSRPVEYMTFATSSHMDHVELKSPLRLRSQVEAAGAEASAFMFIDGIDPDGGANDAHYDLVHEAFAAGDGVLGRLGGEPLADVAIYFSNESKLDFAENGSPLAGFDAPWAEYPHLSAVRGACRALQRAHLPFAVTTRERLGELGRFPALVLPGVARMDAEEVAAIREYVRAGGRLYASRYASLVETAGRRQADFALGDVFGAELEGEEAGTFAYAEPASPELASLLAPQRELSFSVGEGALDGGLLRLRAREGAEALATLTLPYGHPAGGDRDHHDWSSIHSFPPWERTGSPVLLRNGFGAGEAVYSAFDLERDGSDASDRLFAGLIESLLGERRTLRCEADPKVWVSVFRGDGATEVTLFNPPPAALGGARLRLAPPPGERFVALEADPGGAAVPFELGSEGELECEIAQLPELMLLIARHERVGG